MQEKRDRNRAISVIFGAVCLNEVPKCQLKYTVRYLSYAVRDLSTG